METVTTRMNTMKHKPNPERERPEPRTRTQRGGGKPPRPKRPQLPVMRRKMGEHNLTPAGERSQLSNQLRTAAEC